MVKAFISINLLLRIKGFSLLCFGGCSSGATVFPIRLLYVLSAMLCCPAAGLVILDAKLGAGYVYRVFGQYR